MVFPGQGAQAVGMGRDLAAAFAEARRVFEEVDDALGEHLSRLIAEGPEQELTLTRNTQPALMAVSIAALRVLERVSGTDVAGFCRFVAGHSLGEYTALTAAGSLSVNEAARLLRIRGEAMQQAVSVGEGAMAALMGLDLEAVRDVTRVAAEEDGVCTLANDNAPGQVVISESRSAVERAIAIAADRGGRRSVMLPVSAPFHSPLMEPAADALSSALDQVDLRPPAVPVISNVTASEIREPGEIRKLLVEQITGMVRWRESVAYMRAREIDTLVEVGFGRVLGGLAKRIDRDLATFSVGTAEELNAFAEVI